MVHDFATRKKAAKAYKTQPTRTPLRKNPIRMAVVMALLATVSVGALSFSHVVSAVSEDINESLAEAKARKETERALKAHKAAEKLRIADERRVRRKIEADKAVAERSAGYDFYENLVGRSWPVPVESEAYQNKTAFVTAGVKEDTNTIPYSLQAALYREQSEALVAQKQLAKLGYPGKVDDVKVKAGGTLYRVTLGPFTGLEKATQVRDSLHEHNYYAQVFRE